MWTIRQEQTEVFRQHHLQKFEDEMVEHLKKFSPQHCKVAGEPAVRQVIRMGIESASKYGLTNRGPVRFYIELMFMFGSHFDTDPQYPWFAEILNDPAGEEQMVRADRAYEAMTDYWTSVVGPRNSFAFAALHKLSQARAEDYVTPGVPLEECFLGGLRSIYPEKCEYVGEAPLWELLKETFKVAHKYGFASNGEKGLMTALTFFFGHECARDPLHGWIAMRLADKRFAGSAERSTELRAKAMLHLKYTLEGRERTV